MPIIGKATDMILKRLASVFLLAASLGPNLASADQIRIGAINYPPYVIVEDDGTVSGSVPEMLEAAFAAAGDDVVFEVLPFARTISLAETGSIDAAAILNPTSSEVLLLSDRSVGTLNQVFFVRKDSDWRYDGIASLSDQTVATVAGYDYTTMSPEYQTYLDTEPTVVSVSSSDDYLPRIARMIQSGRIDLFNEAEDTMFYWLRTMGIEREFKTAGTLGTPIHMHTGFKPGTDGAAIKQRFDDGFEKAVADGTIQKILTANGLTIAE